MKRIVCILMAMCIVFTMAACGAKQAGANETTTQASEAPAQAEQAAAEWTRQGYFTDENENMLTVMWMEEVDEPGWYVGVMAGELAGGCVLPQEGCTLHGDLNGWDESAEPLIVTVSEEGEDGLLLTIDGGESYHFTPMQIEEASIVVTINTEGWGNIAYAEGDQAPELDPEYPSQSAYIGLAEPATHTFIAQPQAGNLFVKWTKNGEDFSKEPQITLLLDESAEYIAVFEEDPDWHNPVMSFIGVYQCDRARANVECSGYDEAWISIEWASSASEMTNWVISGRLDTDTRSITYDGCSKTNFVYDNSGEVVSDDSEYEDIPGVITFNDDGSFTWHRDLPESGEDTVFEWVGMQQDLFSYEHDPRENPEAMKDIVENADAVYGFSPNPESTRLGVYAEYDWTDPEFVAEAQEERRAYHESMSTMMDILYEMRAEGASIEEMARAVSTERNRLRLEAYKDDPEGLEKLKQSNLDTYGHEDGPTPDELYEKYGSWALVIQKAFGTNMGMDACCGLYDEYYQLYIELGYVDE